MTSPKRWRSPTVSWCCATAASPSTRPSLCRGHVARRRIRRPLHCRPAFSTKSEAYPAVVQRRPQPDEAAHMTELRIVGISGNLTRPSKTRVLVGEILRQAESFGLGKSELYDLVDAGPELGA